MTIEEKVKQWMRIGLQDGVWIELFPGSEKVHPWFNADKTVNRDVVARDAMEAYNIPEYGEVVLDWADEVATEYEQQKAQVENGRKSR